MFALEHSKAAYWFDFALYGAAIGVLVALLMFMAPRAEALELALLAAGGLAGWSLIEYGMHRFILHGMEPFRSWHAQHHQRPTALIAGPTALSASLIAMLVFLPVFFIGGTWPAVAVTLGVTAGYLAYALGHHATHHWRSSNAWLLERKRWHAMHHRRDGAECYGVSSSLWDRIFHTAGPRAPS